MNVKRFILSLAVALFAFSTTLVAQQLNPAKWKYEVKSTSDSEAELIFTVALENNWHIYSQHTDAMGPIGLSFDFKKSDNYTLIGGVSEPKPHEEFDEMFKCTVRSFSGTVVFRQ